jgi:hypothetical protein
LHVVIDRKAREKETRWVDNTKMDAVEIEWGGVDWIEVAQDRYK